MYNEEYKMKYAMKLVVTTSKNEFVRIAEQSQPLEEALGKDLRDFSNLEIIQLLNRLCLTSPLSVKQYASSISKYQSWGLPNGVVRTPVSKYEIDFPSAYRKSYHASFSDLKSDLQIAFELDQGYGFIIALCFAWLGVSMKDFGKIRKEDVDLKNGILSYNGMEIGIEKDILQILRAYAHITVAYRTQGRTFEVYPLPSPYFITRMATKNSRKIAREVKREDITDSFRVINSKILDATGRETHITYLNTQRSGEFYRLRQLELSGVDVFDKSNENAVTSIFSATIPYYEITFMYKQYKEAFGL